MIFVTVGSQMPFDRLVRLVDDWARVWTGQVVAQVGVSNFEPNHLQAFSSVEPARYRELVSECELVIGHAGMGTVLTALEFGKPMLLMPRLEALGETRNDHQVATLKWLQGKPGIFAAFSEQELRAWLERIGAGEGLAPPDAAAAPPARMALIKTVADFIERC